MREFFRPANLLFYFLSMLVIFFLGTIGAGIAGVAKNQGLAGPAIVLGYGVLSGFIAFLAAIPAAHYLRRQRVVLCNKILLVAFVLIAVFLAFRYQARQTPAQPSGQQQRTQTR